MPQALNTVEIQIIPTPGSPPSRTISDIPWYPGMTALDAMIIGDGMFADTFRFQLVYASFYGAWVSSIDGLANAGSSYWIMDVNGVQSPTGISETLLPGVQTGSTIQLTWTYKPFADADHPAAKAMQAVSGS